MIRRNSFILLMSGSSVLLLGAGLLGNQALFGALIGYWIGVGCSVWVQREAALSIELELKPALRRMRRGFFGRLGVVTTAVVAVARFQREWLLFLALGIAVGVILSIITIAINMLRGEGGDK